LSITTVGVLNLALTSKFVCAFWAPDGGREIYTSLGGTSLYAIFGGSRYPHLCQSILIVGVISGRETEEKLPSLLCGGGEPKGYRARVLTKPCLGGGAPVSWSSLLVLISASPSSLLPWPTSSFYRPRRGSTLGGSLEKESPDDGKTKHSTPVKSCSSVSV
jgi:hypothetical protein